MKVKCISNKGADLPVDCLDPASGFDKETVFSLVTGKVYVVYGITLFLGHLWYYICDEDFTYYPVWNPSPLFNVVDGSISKYWKYGYSRDKASGKEYVIIAFEEWVDNPYFYDQLTDGDQKAVALFRRYKEMMDVEFFDPSINKTASKLDNGWVMCPDCNEAWETSSLVAILKCPKCLALMQNPYESGR